MVKVNFAVDCDAAEWHVFFGADPDGLTPLFSMGTTPPSMPMQLSAGRYYVQFTIQGETGSGGKLTINRPVYNDKIVTAKISAGGSAQRLVGFNVVEEGQ